MSIPSQDVVKFLTRELGDLTGEGPVLRFELFHSIEGEVGERLGRWSVEDGANAEELAQEMWSVAEGDAQTQMGTGLERYIIHSYRNANENEGAVAFILRCKPSREKYGAPTEPPTDKGLLSQLMRHNEHYARLTQETVASTQIQLLKDLEQARQRIKDLEATHFEVFKLREQLLDGSTERKLAEQNALARQENMRLAAGQFMKLLPEIVGKVIPAKPNEAAPKTQKPAVTEDELKKLQSVLTLLENLDVEEIQHILQAVKPSTRDAFMGLYSNL